MAGDVSSLFRQVECWSGADVVALRPVEIVSIPIVPSDFFECNPSIDVPSNKNKMSQLADCEKCEQKSKL